MRVKDALDMQIRPLEEAYKFGHFFSPLMTESDFEAKPSVLLLGQYSTGKTTFIKFLLGREDGYPGILIDPGTIPAGMHCHAFMCSDRLCTVHDPRER